MKAFYSLLFSLFFFSLLQAQAPINDDCAGIIDLGEVPYCSAPAQYTNVDATASDIDPVFNIPACFNNGDVQRDVWFQFTIPNDGSILDITIQVFGNIDGNGTLENPQVALYRGDCVYGGLSELECASAPNGVNEVTLDVFGLTPGYPYFLRINDYSATATPNAGTFKLCVEKYEPEVIMGTVASTQSCSGTLLDSGGAEEGYSPSENLSFTICPTEFHQCIILNVVEYDTENNFDEISFIAGDDLSDPQVIVIDGQGQNFEVQISTDCATIGFSSDNSVQNSGFTITWECSTSPCTVPPITTCDEPVSIPALPYTNEGLSNCFSGNAIAFGPCNNDDFLQGNDYVFSYTSPGDECIQVSAYGTNEGVGLGVYDGCPTLSTTNCVAAVGGFFGPSDPTISAAFLEQPGTYYIVFGSTDDCSSFSIFVDTVTCPIVLPSASFCEDALNIGGCSTTLPEIIALNPGEGDPDFIQPGINAGCIAGPQFNYAFFYFQAGADGKFGFIVQAANPDEASDIDLSVWGPIDSYEEICEFASNNEPARSTWTGGTLPTGLADIHPVTGITVTDDYDCGSPATPGAGGDRVVRRLDVEEGKFYLVFLDDFGGAIESDGISINFSGTTEGVLNAEDNLVFAGPDTVICSGEPVQLNATGGLAYSWTPDATLSCGNCPNPVATPTETTVYVAQIASTCNTFIRDVTVVVYDLDLGPNPVVCENAEFEINENPFEGVQYQWTGTGLSCTDCPTPTVSGLTAGTWSFSCVLTSPFCTLYDTITVTVLPGQQPQYNIANDIAVCEGTTVSLGGQTVVGTTYNWISEPEGFVSQVSNPIVTPTQTTKYYLTATAASCAVPALDSVVVTVLEIPHLDMANDTSICQGQFVEICSTQAVDSLDYFWTLSLGSLGDPTSPYQLVNPESTTTYTLTANNGVCQRVETVTVSVIPISLQMNVSDSLRICQGETVNLQAQVSPNGTPVTWSPNTGLQIAPGNLSALAQPYESTLYTITASVPGCIRQQQVYIAVDSLPDNLDILPSDTTICLGQQVLLTSPVYEPAEYQYMDFTWTPLPGQLTPDSLFNMVARPNITTLYRRITTNGACADTAYSNVTVIQPATMTVTPPEVNLCLGSSTQLIVTYTPGVTEIMWSPASGLSCADCDTTIVTALGGVQQYTVSGSYQGCPTAAIAVVTTSSPPPLQFPANTTLCIGESITLNEVVQPGATYVWTSNDPNFAGSTEAQPIVTPSQTSSYYVTASNGCSVTDTITITVAPDAVLTVSNDTTICKNLPVTLSASSTIQGAYTWNDGQTTQTINVQPSSTTTYTVTFTSQAGCQKTESVTVTIDGEAVSFGFPANNEICPGASVTLNTAPTPAGATYQWTASPADPTLISSAGSPSVSPIVATTYSVTATNGLCVSTGSVTISPILAELEVSPDITVCLGDAATLVASGSVAGSYAWSNGDTGASISVDPVANQTYTVTFIYGGANNCILTEQVTVTVAPAFTLSITPDVPVGTTDLYIGQTLELTAVVTPATNVQNFSFVWKENNVNSIGTTQVITTQITTQEDSIRYVVIAASPEGCVREAQIVFPVQQPVVDVPNAFTPGNGDENNDTFKLVIVKGEASVIVEKTEVYSRWGQLVFSSTNNGVWDGTVDGKPAPVDTYIYRITWRRGDGSLQPQLIGEITLLR